MNPLFEYTLPWPTPVVADYRSLQYKKWRCRPTPSYVGPGYWSPFTHQPSGWLFDRKKAGKWVIWMSLTMMELESHQPHIAAAKGFVVVAGLGMGMYLYNILRKPEVETVVCVERDPQIIEMLKLTTDLEKWPGYEKLILINDDAMNYTLTIKPNFFYADIWEKLGHINALEMTQRMQKNIKAHEVGFWGQEFDYVTWLMNNNIPIKKSNLDNYNQFCKDVNLPLVCRNMKRYPKLASAAVTIQTVNSTKNSQQDRFVLSSTALSLLCE